MARGENKSTAKLMNGWIYHETGGVPVGSPAWSEWLNNGPSFYVELPAGGYTVRREVRKGSFYWYAFKRVNKKLHKVYVGRSHELTVERFAGVLSEFQAKMAATKISVPPGF